MTHKTDAARMFFVAQRADRLFAVLDTLDDLIEHMDDVGPLKAARDLITSRWEDEQNDVMHWQQLADKAIAQWPKRNPLRRKET